MCKVSTLPVTIALIQRHFFLRFHPAVFWVYLLAQCSGITSGRSGGLWGAEDRSC